MRIINKKYLLIILLIGIILTGVIFLKPKENIQLDDVILKQEVNNKTFAMYKEDGENNYVPVTENKFPDMYVLNLTESKCIDNNGNELDGVLSYENDKVTITSGNTTYCYLYFDKSLGLEIKEKKPSGLSIDQIRGAMYRYQGQAKDSVGKELVNNYICFGTSDQNTCKGDTDHYMYRIIGIEAETGRLKVIKMKALNETYQWHTDYDTDIEFPDSKIYKAINGDGFLENPTYIPEGWEEKISDNSWLYGDMQSDSTIGARQTGEGLYLVETGQKETVWDEKAKEGDSEAKSIVVGHEPSKYYNQTIYYIRHNNETWNKIFESKISLMYLHDYYYSVSDTANCQYSDGNYDMCKTSWIHLSQNDSSVNSNDEWTMTRNGFDIWSGYFSGSGVGSTGYSSIWGFHGNLSARPVFYINAKEELLSGTGTITDPFMIKE